jgi:hypothetical protein
MTAAALTLCLAILTSIVVRLHRKAKASYGAMSDEEHEDLNEATQAW